MNDRLFNALAATFLGSVIGAVIGLVLTLLFR